MSQYIYVVTGVNHADGVITLSAVVRPEWLAEQRRISAAAARNCRRRNRRKGHYARR